MNYLKKYCLFLILVAVFNVEVLSQNNNLYNITTPPTASSFTYPQSIFVDSPNGHIWVTDFSNHRVLRFDVASLTSIDESPASLAPSTFFLSQNYPNPFNAKTKITFSTRLTGEVALSVHNVLGQQVTTLFKNVATAYTMYSITFDAGNLPSGIYLYALHTADGYEVKAMCLLK